MHRWRKPSRNPEHWGDGEFCAALFMHMHPKHIRNKNLDFPFLPFSLSRLRWKLGFPSYLSRIWDPAESAAELSCSSPFLSRHPTSLSLFLVFLSYFISRVSSVTVVFVEETNKCPYLQERLEFHGKECDPIEQIVTHAVLAP